MNKQKLIYKRYPIFYNSFKQVGGEPNEETICEFKRLVLACDLHKGQINYDHSTCPKCIFTNAGQSENPNKCTPIDGNGGYCFQDSTGAYNRMDIRKYLEAKSKITVENNIYVVEPDGEICFGNTITTCLTYCFILSDSSKIAVHLNPFTNISQRSEMFKNDNSPNVILNETVNIYNVLNLMGRRITGNKKIIKIYVFGASEYKVYYHNNNYFIGDVDSVGMIGESMGYAKTDKSIKQHLIDELGQSLSPNCCFKFMQDKEIKQGSIYFINSLGDAVMQDNVGRDISNWTTL